MKSSILALKHPYKGGLLRAVRECFQQLSRTEPHNRRSDQVLPFLLQNTSRVALHRFVRAEMSRGQHALSPSRHPSLVYGLAQVRNSTARGNGRRHVMEACTVTVCLLS